MKNKNQFDHRFLLHAFRLRHVKRFAICPCLMPDTVANHSWMTAVLAKYICVHMEFNEWSVDSVVCSALLHDFPEAVMSDIPYFIKNHTDLKEPITRMEASIAEDSTDHPTMQQCLKDALSGEYNLLHVVVEICDLLDGVIYLHHEQMLGNIHQWVTGVRDSMTKLIFGKITLLNEKSRAKLRKLIKEILDDVENWSSFRHDHGVGKSYDKMVEKFVAERPGDCQSPSEHPSGYSKSVQRRIRAQTEGR